MKFTAIRRLSPSLLLFLFFAAATVWRDHLLPLAFPERMGRPQLIVDYLIQIGFWVSGAGLLNKFLTVFFWDLLATRREFSVPKLLRDVVTLLIYVMAVIVITGAVFDKPLTGFWATSGLVGLVIGFALRNIILDVFSGLAINVEQPYRIGDWIEMHNRLMTQSVVGQVIEVNWRTTRLVSDRNTLVVVPNSIVSTTVLINYWNPSPPTQYELLFVIDFSVPVERARRVLLAGAKSVLDQEGFVPDREPRVLVSNTSGLGIEYKVLYWITPWRGKGPGVARDAIATSILEHLSRAGISLAYPKRDTYFGRMPARHLDPASLADRRQLLSRVVLFTHLEGEELDLLAEKMGQRFFRNGQMLIRAGDQGDSMFILLEGLLHVQADFADGRPSQRVGQIIPGQFFGEMSLLTGEPRSATVVAATDASVYEITKDDLEPLFARRPELVEAIGQVVAERRFQIDQASADAIAREQIQRTESASLQLVKRIRTFFGF